MSGKLFDYLEKSDSRAQNELDRLIPLLVEQQGYAYFILLNRHSGVFCPNMSNKFPQIP